MMDDVFMASVHPPAVSDDFRLFVRQNMASYALYCMRHNYSAVVLEYVFVKDEYVDDLIKLMGNHGGKTHVISLLADKEVHEKRLKDKAGGKPGAEKDIAPALMWMELMRKLTRPTPIDTSKRSIEESSEEILRLIQ